MYCVTSSLLEEQSCHVSPTDHMTTWIVLHITSDTITGGGGGGGGGGVTLIALILADHNFNYVLF